MISLSLEQRGWVVILQWLGRWVETLSKSDNIWEQSPYDVVRFHFNTHRQVRIRTQVTKNTEKYKQIVPCIPWKEPKMELARKK